jgi:2-oxo-4-hydroxy-4-carboxy-5-ureidoimidazoline decarboxylase
MLKFPSCYPKKEMTITDKPSVPELFSKPKEDILAFLGKIYEHSSWIAENFYDEYVEGQGKEFTNVQEVFRAMSSVVEKSSNEQKLTLLQAHPDLCAKIESLKKLTKESQVEQGKAGLATLTDEERAKFTKLNSEYREKFGFPFILAARNATKYTVLSAIEGRVSRSPEDEFAGALYQV